MSSSDKNHSENIRELQQYLYKIARHNHNIPIIIPDGIYGDETKKAVEAFQKEYELPITGEVNFATWEEIVHIYCDTANITSSQINIFPSSSYVLKEGDKGSLVFITQTMLDSISKHSSDFPQVIINGIFDANTIKGVKHFQNMTSIEETSEVNQKTWNKLVNLFNHLENTHTPK